MFDERSQQLDRVVNLLDIGLTIVVYLSSYFVVQVCCFTSIDDKSFFPHFAILPFVLAIFAYTFPYFGSNQSPRVATPFSYAWAIARSVGLGVAILMTILFFLKIQYVSRLVILVFAILEIAVMTSTRLFVLYYFRKSLKSGKNNLRVLIIGSGERARKMAFALRRRSEWGINIVGCLDVDPARVGASVDDVQVLGTVHDISEVLKENVIDEVILAVPRTLLQDVEEIAYVCQEEGVKFRLMADIFSLQLARIRLTELGSIPLLTLEPVAQDEAKLLVKRLVDILFVLCIAPFLVPLFLVIAIAIKLDSPGPVIFAQERVGLRKRIFKMYKFRSMVENSEELLKEIEHLNEAQGPNFKIKNDPRLTRVGKFIRKTSLDEFPQFLNVFKGDMSLVGPRPMSLRDVDLFDRGVQRKRFSVKPGLTCLWQISGRSDLSFDQWLELDLAYIENWSLGLDFKILLKTIPVVLKGSGAV